ncbi:hypothetical protein [Microbacterium sp. NPDC087589]|uniref:hypothetical protein n=1 Tax=Microbacterium sp. NPDC087589 TaxID=3364191 RepID=UPI003800C772
MTDDESEVEETVMLTRRDRRRNGAAAASPPAPAEAETAAVADDSADADADADAGAGADADADAFAGLGDVDESTVVVDRKTSRSGAPPDALEGEQEQQLTDESTVLVSRTPRRVRRKRSERPDERGGASGDPAPVTEPGAAPLSFEAPSDAPAPEIYRPRPAPLGPSAPPVVIGAAAPTRAVDPELPSVAKQGLRWSRATLLAFAAACVVSVAGLVAVGFVVFA